MTTYNIPIDFTDKGWRFFVDAYNEIAKTPILSFPLVRFEFFSDFKKSWNKNEGLDRQLLSNYTKSGLNVTIRLSPEDFEWKEEGETDE